jgi:hypothetical protein
LGDAALEGGAVGVPECDQRFNIEKMTVLGAIVAMWFTTCAGSSVRW